jgi:hypothetical protein
VFEHVSFSKVGKTIALILQKPSAKKEKPPRAAAGKAVNDGIPAPLSKEAKQATDDAKENKMTESRSGMRSSAAKEEKKVKSGDVAARFAGGPETKKDKRNAKRRDTRKRKRTAEVVEDAPANKRKMAAVEKKLKEVQQEKDALAKDLAAAKQKKQKDTEKEAAKRKEEEREEKKNSLAESVMKVKEAENKLKAAELDEQLKKCNAKGEEKKKADDKVEAEKARKQEHTDRMAKLKDDEEFEQCSADSANNKVVRPLEYAHQATLLQISQACSASQLKSSIRINEAFSTSRDEFARKHEENIVMRYNMGVRAPLASLQSNALPSNNGALPSTQLQL